MGLLILFTCEMSEDWEERGWKEERIRFQRWRNVDDEFHVMKRAVKM